MSKQATLAQAEFDAAFDGVTIQPDASKWNANVQKWLDTPCDPRVDRARFRREIGIHSDLPVVMTGHQPVFWHPGVYAKYVAASVFAEILQGRCAWVVSDQDVVDPCAVGVPVRDAHGAIRKESMQLADAMGGNVAAASAPAVKPIDVSSEPLVLDGSVRSGVEAMRRAIESNASASTLAKQLVGAAMDLATESVSSAPVVYASELSKTTCFAWFLDRLREDPYAAIASYNRAVAAEPGANMAPLQCVAGEVCELPLWRLVQGSPRRRVYAHELDSIPMAELAPRALPMTGLLRAAGCDCFIHGLGGGAYDRITERWFGEWLGLALAPSVVVSATLRLPLAAFVQDRADGVAHRNTIPSQKNVAKAVWKAHHARHCFRQKDEKKAYLQRIEKAKVRGDDSAHLFAELQEALQCERNAQAEELASLRAEAEQLRALAASREVLTERTWAFPLHEQGAMQLLSDAVRQAIASGVNSKSSPTPQGQPQSQSD